MQYADILFGVGALVAMFASQVYLVKRLTAFVKELSGLDGNSVRLLAFVIGAVIGGLFFWPWVEMNPGMNLSIYVLTGVIFLLIAGLTASGDYDLSKEDKSIAAGTLGDRDPGK